MAEPGDRYQFPDGSTYIVNSPSSESGGEFVEMEFVLPAGCLPPPPHIHPHQVESYTVLEGSIEIVINGIWRTLGPGESASVPIGASHTFRNCSGSTIRVQNWHRPAMRFESFIQEASENMRNAGIKAKRDPRVLLYLSMAMMKFSETLRPSRRRERIPMLMLAKFGQLLRLD
ncbi:MAG: cupin domain-containing protein [Solirubrobacterales bacterium]|nr:cupin domain-containing protein [Solirubrobacterales bacterium]